MVQGKFSNCVCAVGATCTFRPACQGRTIFSSVTGWSPAPSPGSDAGSLASSALPLASLASHLSLAASLHGWPAGVENQPLMGLRGLEEGTAGVVERMKAPGGAACTD